MPEFIAAVYLLDVKGSLIIGGKSMGGRGASMVADRLCADGRISGLLCIGYPFHPPERPEQLRNKHLLDWRMPTLICQGTRDPFGKQEEVRQYRLSGQIESLWLADGDLDLKPRKNGSGFSQVDHLQTVAEKVKAWTRL